MSARDFKRLATAVLNRRAELRVSQEEFVRDVDLSVKGLQRIESGELTRIRAKTIGELDRAARWRPGSVQVTLDGGDPTPLDDAGGDLRDEAERQLWAITDLSEEERWAFIDLHRARQSRESRRFGE
jgi:transcriptional regulator with XRE-family HTH domain